MLKRIFHRLFPANCQLCQLALTCPESWVCHCCASQLPRPADGCQTCGVELFSDGQLSCGHCLKYPPEIDRLISALDYQFPINPWMTEFKFHQRYALANWFGDMLALRLQDQLTEFPDALIPVPLHPTRTRSRGYNQSLLIAQYLAKRLNISLLKDSAKRQLNTPAQSQLNLKQRKSNLHNAFSVTGVLPKSIAIIDDVFTSGSTINELAKTLKQTGCEQVQAWVVAHAPTK